MADVEVTRKIFELFIAYARTLLGGWAPTQSVVIEGDLMRCHINHGY